MRSLPTQPTVKQYAPATRTNAAGSATANQAQHLPTLCPPSAHIARATLPPAATAQDRNRWLRGPGKGGEGGGEREGHRSPFALRAMAWPKMLRSPRFLTLLLPTHRDASVQLLQLHFDAGPTDLSPPRAQSEVVNAQFRAVPPLGMTRHRFLLLRPVNGAPTTQPPPLPRIAAWF